MIEQAAHTRVLGRLLPASSREVTAAAAPPPQPRMPAGSAQPLKSSTLPAATTLALPRPAAAVTAKVPAVDKPEAVAGSARVSRDCDLPPAGASSALSGGIVLPTTLPPQPQPQQQPQQRQQPQPQQPQQQQMEQQQAEQQQAGGDGSDGPSPVASDPSSPTDADDATAEAGTVLVVEEDVLPPAQFTKGAAQSSTALPSAGLVGVLKKPAAVRVPDGAQGGAGAAPPTLVATLSTGAACIESCRDIVSILSAFVRL